MKPRVLFPGIRAAFTTLPVFAAVLLVSMLALSPVRAQGQSLDWITATTRSDDEIIRFFLESELATGIDVMRLLARRSDQYVQDIIGPLLDQLGAREQLLVEFHLLEVLQLSPDAVDGWVRANPELVNRLFAGLHQFERTRLRGAVLNMAPYLSRPDTAGIVARHLALVVDTPSVSGPYETLALLRAAASTQATELAHKIVELSEVIGHPDLVQRARQTARFLVDPEAPDPF